MNKLNSLSIIDNTDIDSFKNTMGKIQQFQRLVRENLIEGKDYGTIPGTSKPTLYKAGAEKIVILGKLRSTFDVLNETKDYEREFFDFEIRWNLWAGDNLLVQGVGLCNSKEDKYRYRWVTEKKMPSNIDKSKLVSRNKTGKYGDYREYRMVNEDVCTLANTILKMAKKRALVDAALLVGSLSDLFTQDIEDLPEEYLRKETNTKVNPEEKPAILKQKEEIEVSTPLKKHIEESKSKLEKRELGDDWASEKQVKLIKANIIASSLITKPEKSKIQDYLDNGLTKMKASEIISWWIGDIGKGITGERQKRNTAKPDKGIDKPAGTMEKFFEEENKLIRQKTEMEDDITDEDLGITGKQPGIDS
jgi:hypothetical protein